MFKMLYAALSFISASDKLKIYFLFKCADIIKQNFSIVKDFETKACATAFFIRASDYL